MQLVGICGRDEHHAMLACLQHIGNDQLDDDAEEIRIQIRCFLAGCKLAHLVLVFVETVTCLHNQ